MRWWISRSAASMSAETSACNRSTGDTASTGFTTSATLIWGAASCRSRLRLRDYAIYPCQGNHGKAAAAMREVLKLNNPVDLSYAEAVLKDAGIASVVFDDQMSVMDGSMVILPRRLMVADEDMEAAKSLLKDALNP